MWKNKTKGKMVSDDGKPLTLCYKTQILKCGKRGNEETINNTDIGRGSEHLNSDEVTIHIRTMNIISTVVNKVT